MSSDNYRPNGNSDRNSGFSDVYSDPNLNLGNNISQPKYDYKNLENTFGGNDTQATSAHNTGARRTADPSTRVARPRNPSSSRQSATRAGATRHGTAPRPNPQRRPVRRRRRKPNIIPVIILGVVGVIIIALLITGLQALFSLAGGGETEAHPTPTPAPTIVPTAEPRTTPIPQGANESSVEGLEPVVYQHMFIVGDGSFDIYKFNETIADSYVDAINDVTSDIPEDVNVYQMMIPNSMDIMLPLDFLNYYADVTSDQEKSIQYIYSGADERIENIEIYRILKAHCDEKLYYKTENKWTGLAAYYAYNEWCYKKDLDNFALASYSELEVEGFLGYNYHFSLHSNIEEPETIEVYVPSPSLTFSTGTSLSDLTEAEMFPDVSSLESRSKYQVYLGGSNDLGYIKNSSNENGKTCVIVGDSNMTTLAPFISQNYENLYIVDYRYYSAGTLAQLVSDVSAQDVLFATSIAASSSTDLVQNLSSLA